MAGETQAVQRLLALPKSERYDALDDMVCEQFRRSLLLTEDEELPRFDSFFDIGLTSLRLTEIKQELEELLGCAISDTEVFNQPTVEQLIQYLVREVLPEVFGGTEALSGRPMGGRRAGPHASRIALTFAPRRKGTMTPPESRTAHAALTGQARSRPRATAISFEDREVTFGELDAGSNQVARALTRSGICRGSRVAYYGMDTPEYYEIALGVLKAGAVFVPVNWRLSDSEVDHIIRDSGAELLFTEPRFEPAVGRLAPALPGLRDVISVEGPGSGGLHAWKDGVSRGSTDPGTGPDDPAIQVYTSGTTGVPKGVVLAHRSFFAFVEAMAGAGTDWFDWLPDDVSLVSFPGSYAAGLEWFMHGVMAGIPSVVMRVFTADAAVRLIERHGVTITYAAPAMLRMMLDQQRVGAESFRSLRKVAYGAAPMDDALLERCLDVMGCQFVQVYASTETGNVATILPPGDHVPGNPLLRSVGRACPGNELRIVDDEAHPLPPGRIGQIWIKTPARMLEYWRQPEATARTLSGGWLRMGDAGYVDDRGYLFLADRLDDTIIVAGQNIYPAEVEAALASHPLVAEAAVVGVPDARWGEAVCACVVPAPDGCPAERDLLLHLRGRVADFKVPTRWVFAADLPRNPTGKVLRRVLRERFQTQDRSTTRP